MPEQPNEIIDTAKALVLAALQDAERGFIERIKVLDVLTVETTTKAARDATHAVINDAFPMLDAMVELASK